jgi:hypothetical protein
MFLRDSHEVNEALGSAQKTSGNNFHPERQPQLPPLSVPHAFPTNGAAHQTVDHNTEHLSHSIQHPRLNSYDHYNHDEVNHGTPPIVIHDGGGHGRVYNRVRKFLKGDSDSHIVY